MEKKDVDRIPDTQDDKPAQGFESVGKHADNVIDLADEARKRRIRSPTEFWW
ncbi:MAG: hypothetical protein JKY23_03465 [Nitrospinaceae bacterium]|nr:hypothetical protein [Nitrospinaceae bacterium]